MPPRDVPFGPDTLVIPAYVSNGPNDPGLAAWKLDHPDCFEAGTWTPSPAPPEPTAFSAPSKLQQLTPAPDPPIPGAPA